MQEYTALHEQVVDLKADLEKFYKGHNQAAGTRARNGLQSIKVLAQQLRVDIQEQKRITTAERSKGRTK